jgi:hypothetical protein
MLPGKQNSIIRRIILPLVFAMIIAITACSTPKGSIVILENTNGTGFTMDFKEWSSSDKCELSLNKDDVLQVEVIREGGEIALEIRGKMGSEPYTGNHLESGVFTVKVSETDQYVIRITGKNASGKVIVKKVE